MEKAYFKGTLVSYTLSDTFSITYQRKMNVEEEQVQAPLQLQLQQIQGDVDEEEMEINEVSFVHRNVLNNAVLDITVILDQDGRRSASLNLTGTDLVNRNLKIQSPDSVITINFNWRGTPPGLKSSRLPCRDVRDCFPTQREARQFLRSHFQNNPTRYRAYSSHVSYVLSQEFLGMQFSLTVLRY